MTVAQNFEVPAAWVQAIQRHAPEAAVSFVADARRYLTSSSPERVPAGREVDTLKNLIAAHVTPAHREAVLYELAVLSLQSTSPLLGQTRAPRVAELLALGSMVATGLILARRRR